VQVLQYLNVALLLALRGNLHIISQAHVSHWDVVFALERFVGVFELDKNDDASPSAAIQVPDVNAPCRFQGVTDRAEQRPLAFC
jgi:hypothetical protein